MDRSSKPLKFPNQSALLHIHNIHLHKFASKQQCKLHSYSSRPPTVATFTQNPTLTTNPMVIQPTSISITVPSVMMRCNILCFNLSRTPTGRIPTNQINILAAKTNHLLAAAPLILPYIEENEKMRSFPITDQLSST